MKDSINLDQLDKVVITMDKDREFHTYRGYQLLKQDQQSLTPSMEDYLEMIFRFCDKNKHIRINQLADELNVQASSATKNVQKLSELGLLKYEKYGIIEMTEEGKDIGHFLLKRHMIIETFLSKLGIKASLLKDTEMIEHNISAATVNSIELLSEFLDAYPDILDKFNKWRRERDSNPR